ncbi:MAG: DUF4421 family protein [Bacteroidaceae bacterium]|nr:DUF4421 family protein [Bacteroidaceae bacterium]
MNKLKLLVFTLFILSCNAYIIAQTDNDETSTELNGGKKKKSFGQKLLTPIKWIGENWTASDPRYAVPSFYNWAGQIQNTTSFEWLRLNTEEGVDINMNSKISNRIGPYFGWRWIFFGATIDLSSIGKPSTRKNEFTLSINSALFNIDLIRRRTGGDFNINKLHINNGYVDDDFADILRDYDLGDYIKNSLTGVNINYFVNHKKYSNPAAFSNGAIQLRSAGSPIIGLGYTHQNVQSDFSDIITEMFGSLLIENPYTDVTEEDIEGLANLWDEDENKYYNKLAEYMEDAWDFFKEIDKENGHNTLTTLITNRIPTKTTIDDWHLQLGYAYNLVFSRRLLLGLSVIASPGIKRVRASNEGSTTYCMADYYSDIIQRKEGRTVDPNYFRYHYDQTQVNVNLFARASLTWNYNRWRAGFLATFSNYFFKKGSMKVSNGFGNLAVYVGYCFGRKKEYRHGGAMREDYIKAALTKSQIEEMKDTMPKSNINDGGAYLLAGGKKTKYHTDEFNVSVFGCDLVAGPDGRFGWYEIQDGYVAPGQDTEGRLRSGTVVEVDKNGKFRCEAGHDNSIRAGNWWKSQLSIDQIPNHWYPEMLHYALKGKLTLYLRGRIFGTKKPVKVEFDDFCVNHGKETNSFYQMGIRSYKSYSTYSIEGHAEINGKDCRVYIEQKKRGKLTNMYVARLYESNKNWMQSIDGNRPISTLSIPGTHDSGTSGLPEQPAAIFRAGHTQNFSIPAQTADGIRAFDIRLKRDLHYGHTMICRDRFDSTLVAWDKFLTDYPSEFIVALIGSDEGGKWGEELTENYKKVIKKYPHRFVENFSPATPIDSVRGKILVIRRQEECPYGKLLKFTDNAVFEYDGFCVEDVYKEHKTYKKIGIVEQHIRDAYENEDPNKWYFTFNSIAWSPRRHNPYSYAWGGKAKNIRKPMNKSLREIIELKDYNDFGVVFLDFYNDHGDNPQIVETIINSNFNRDYE